VTEWRKAPQYQGGFLLDGGIHVVAAIRLLLGAENSITTLSAYTNLMQEHLPPVDTVDAIMKTKSGATGTFSASYGSDFNDFGFELSCEGGVVGVSRHGVFVKGEDQNIPHDGKGVIPEVADFAASIVKGGGQLDRRQWPEEALADLEILEKMLISGEKDGEKMELSLQG
jgi:predicted dehydrogenase